MTHNNMPASPETDFPNTAAADFLYMTGPDVRVPAGSSFRRLDDERRPESLPLIQGEQDGHTILHQAGPVYAEGKSPQEITPASRIATTGLLAYVRSGAASIRDSVTSFGAEMREVFAPLLPTRAKAVRGAGVATMAITAGITTAYVTGTEEMIGLPPQPFAAPDAEPTVIPQDSKQEKTSTSPLPGPTVLPSYIQVLPPNVSPTPSESASGSPSPEASQSDDAGPSKAPVSEVPGATSPVATPELPLPSVTPPAEIPVEPSPSGSTLSPEPTPEPSEPTSTEAPLSSPDALGQAQ